MSMDNEHKSSADALAAILGTHGNAATETEKDLTTDEMDLATDDLASDGAETTLEVVDDLGAEAQATTRRQRRARGAPKLDAASGRTARLFGLLFLVGGIATTVLDGQGRLPSALTAWGYDSSILLALGTVAFVLGVMRRQTALQQVRMDALSFQQQEAQLDMQANVQWLVEQQQAHAEKPPAAGEELDRVLVVLQRQDEKVNNLSRALKMYGKPLMEIANQGADVGAQVNQLKGHVEALLGAMQQGFTRIETATRNTTVDLAPVEQQIGKVDQQIGKFEQQIGKVDQQIARTATDLQRTLATFAERLPNAQALQQQLVRVEASVQALSQRAEDPEVRKSLVRLEDAAKVHGKKVEELARHESMQGEVQKLERQLDTSIAKLNQGIEQVRTKNLGGLENSVRDIQRELASLATSVAYIQQAVKGGVRATATAAAPMAAAPAQHTATPVAATAAPAHATPTADTAHGKAAEPAKADAPRAPTAAPAAASVDTAGLDDAQAGVAQNRTGARASTGKNVLGAIAKLKKMKN